MRSSSRTMCPRMRPSIFPSTRKDWSSAETAQTRAFLRNCNNAARHARGKYVMFLNNDTQVTENWLSSLVQLIESDPTIGMVGSKLVYPDGRLQEAGGIIWSDGSGWNYGRLDNPDKPEYNYVKDVDYISGAAIYYPMNYGIKSAALIPALRRPTVRIPTWPSRSERRATAWYISRSPRSSTLRAFPTAPMCRVPV